MNMRNLPPMPTPPVFEPNAPIASGVVVGDTGVQFRGRHPLGIKDDVLTVGYPQLLALVGNLLTTMYSDHPSAPQIRAAVAGIQLAPQPPVQ